MACGQSHFRRKINEHVSLRCNPIMQAEHIYLHRVIAQICCPLKKAKQPYLSWHCFYCSIFWQNFRKSLLVCTEQHTKKAFLRLLHKQNAWKVRGYMEWTPPQFWARVGSSVFDKRKIKVANWLFLAVVNQSSQIQLFGGFHLDSAIPNLPLKVDQIDAIKLCHFSIINDQCFTLPRVTTCWLLLSARSGDLALEMVENLPPKVVNHDEIFVDKAEILVLLGAVVRQCLQTQLWFAEHPRRSFVAHFFLFFVVRTWTKADHLHSEWTT